MVDLFRCRQRVYVHRSALTALLALLSGCALSPPTPPQERPCGLWEVQAPKVAALHHWTIAGKVNLKTPQQNDTASFDWQQHDISAYRMMISGPFGIGRNTLSQRGADVTLTNGDGTFHAASPEGLMEQRLGWSLPISSLYYWARALPAPDQGHRLTRDQCGFPASLDQEGWHIDYSQWTYADGYWLPGRLKMRYGELNTTLVLKEWHPNQSDDAQ